MTPPFGAPHTTKSVPLTIAVGHSILEIAYHVLRDGVAYQEWGGNYYDERKKNAVVRQAIKRLERLDYRVGVEPAA